MPSKIRGGSADLALADARFPRPSALVGAVAASVLASVPWVAQWKFNNDGNDSIGTNHLTNNNSATFTTGKLGGATGATQLVAASSQYWSVADNPVLSTGNVDFFVCAWVYLDTKPANAGVLSKLGGAGEREFNLIYFSSGDRFRWNWGDINFGDANTFGAPATATWYLVSAYHRSSDGECGIAVNNGFFDTFTAVGGTDSAVAFSIGRGVVSSNYWDGRIDNVCIAKGTGAVANLTGVRDALYNGGAGTEAITAIMEYQRQQRRIQWEIDRVWERFKRGWFNNGRSRRVFA